MENRRTKCGMECGATFGYVGRARAAPVLARALRRFVDEGRDGGRVAILIPTRSATSWHAIEGSLRYCHDWLVDAPTESGIGVVCVAPEPSSAGHGPPVVPPREHPGFALRGHLAIAAVGRPALARVPFPAPGSWPSDPRTGRRAEDRAAAGRLADVVEELWIPPLQLSVSRALARLSGLFHLIAMTTKEPDRIVCASRGSTLCLGVSEDGVRVGSEPNAVLSDTGRVVFLHSGEIGVLDTEGWDLLEADVLARLRRPAEDLDRYRLWARRRTVGGEPSLTLRIKPRPSPLVGPRPSVVIEPRRRGRSSGDESCPAQGER